jgi:serine/threonine-protein kinase
VIDFGWQRDVAYLVMEHLPGTTVTRAIYQAGRIPAARALWIVREAAIAMAAAHAVNIVHRDLKPDNLFLVPDHNGGERLKVLDFGIAKLLGDADQGHGLTQTGMIMGTPAYMSPEQCRGAGRVDARTDIYALGCVLFHLLTGRTPFVASTPGDLIALHLTAPPPVPSSVTPGISPELDALVLHCLAKNVDERVQTMRELVGRIDELLAEPSQLEMTIARAPAPPNVAVASTTMASSAGEVRGGTPAWRGGLIIGGIVAIGAAITIVALASSGGTTAAKAPLDAPAAVTAPTAAIDAALDAPAPVATPVDAGIDAPPAVKKVPPKKYDPYDNR